MSVDLLGTGKMAKSPAAMILAGGIVLGLGYLIYEAVKGIKTVAKGVAPTAGKVNDAVGGAAQTVSNVTELTSAVTGAPVKLIHAAESAGNSFHDWLTGNEVMGDNGVVTLTNADGSSGQFGPIDN